MSSDQGVLMDLYCATCGNPLPYAGVGRPRKFCDDCRPKWFAPLKEVNRALSRKSDPTTSRDAAQSVDAAATVTRILDAFDQFGWLTPFECADVLDDACEGTVRSAVGRLRKAGVLVDTGTTRPSPRRRASMVLKLADA